MLVVVWGIIHGEEYSTQAQRQRQSLYTSTPQTATACAGINKALAAAEMPSLGVILPYRRAPAGPGACVQ